MTSMPVAQPGAQRCPRCGTELAPGMLSCPACHALLHADMLKQLAAAAEELTTAGTLGEARATWYRALDLLPPSSQQHAIISGKVRELSRRIEQGGSRGTATRSDGPAAQQGEPVDERPWWKRGVAAVAAAALFALGKLKFVLFGLTKAGTLIGMFASLALYWQVFGWPLALGLIIGIYLHEMGHVAALKSEGIEASAPMFIPGIGAFVMWKRHFDDPRLDAKVGLAGPLWGMGAAVIAYLVYLYTGAHVWGAIARGTGYLNLLNLIPVWQLDGSRGFHSLTTLQRWIVVAAAGVAFLLTSNMMLLAVGGVSIYRALQPARSEPDTSALSSWVILIGGLAWLSSIPVQVF